MFLCVGGALLFGNTQSAFANTYKNEVAIGGVKLVRDSDQHHKDISEKTYFLRFRHFVQPVSVFSPLPLESSFMSRSSFWELDLNSEDKTPQDDFTILRATYNKGSEAQNYRLLISYLRSQHATKLGDENLDGGGLGLSIYLLDKAKADFYSEYQSGDGFRITHSLVRFKQVYMAYDTKLSLAVELRHNEKRTPYPSLGREGGGYVSNGWRGVVSWYLSPKVRLGLGHEASSIDYRNHNEGADNAMLVEGEIELLASLSLAGEFSVSREIVERQGFEDVQEDSAKGTVRLNYRF